MKINSEDKLRINKMCMWNTIAAMKSKSATFIRKFNVTIFRQYIYFHCIFLFWIFFYAVFVNDSNHFALPDFQEIHLALGNTKRDRTDR